MSFDTIIIVDWSARSAPSPAKPSSDAIWIARAHGGEVACTYVRTRAEAQATLEGMFEEAIAAGHRVLAGFDFPFAYPKGFAGAITGRADPLAVWDWLAEHIRDGDDNANNRWEVARALNQMLPGIGPFWGCPAHRSSDALPARGSERSNHGLPEKREVEHRVPRAQSCWKLYTTGSVGSQAMLGLPRLSALRRRFGESISVAPFEAPDAPIVLAEVFPSLIAQAIDKHRRVDEIKDRAQVRVLATALAGLPSGTLDRWLNQGDREEGWILGAGEEGHLQGALGVRNGDCYALPAGVDWLAVDDVLANLQARLQPALSTQTIATTEAAGRFLAERVVARRSNPPSANSAVDGYGFAGELPAGAHSLPLVEGRAAAGAPFEGHLPEGHAIRILTGATLPEGVETVVLKESVEADANAITLEGPVKRGANVRKAGEDIGEGEVLFEAGRKISPVDVAWLIATGVDAVCVYRRLRVSVISTGDEIADIAAGDAQGGAIFDANRPMLISMGHRWGFEVVDIGIVADDRAQVIRAFDEAAAHSDVILSSGGASAGDEDHVSAVLNEAGTIEMWRVAVKPGRPLAFGRWRDVPVFGLPGNPVAAFVCALIFAYPALSQLAGGGFPRPAGFVLPAAFHKRKKAGRHEFLRARVRDGALEAFPSEGSGKISGLTWAEGFVELGPEAMDISPGTLVKFIPFSFYGL